MFSDKERELLKISRALITFPDFFLISKEGIVVDSPIILVDLLTKVELETFRALLKVSNLDRVVIEENIVESKVLSVLGTTYEISLDFTPAGVIDSIASAIVKKSEDYLENLDNKEYLETVDSVSYVETMCAIISYYLNTKYEEVLSLPISEIYKRYAICQQAFPNQVQPLEKKE